MQIGVIVAYIRNRKWLENFKNQIMLEKYNLFRGVRVKEPLMNLKKNPKRRLYQGLIHAYLLFKDDLN